MKNEEVEDYPLCSECKFFEGCHSTVFGECWTCGKNYEKCSEVQDNDWEVKNGGEITLCPHYEKGEHLVNVVVG